MSGHGERYFGVTEELVVSRIWSPQDRDMDGERKVEAVREVGGGFAS